MNKKYLIRGGFILIGILFIYLFKPGHNITNYPPRNTHIIAFGDSLVKGVGSTESGDFVSRLSQKLNVPIVNLGVPGETSAQGLSRIDAVISEEPGTVIILFGGNDVLRKVPQKETFTNLKNMISQLQSSGSMVVLLGIRNGLFSDHFDSEFAQLAHETKSIYVPDVLSGLIGDTRYMSDAVHPNDVGYEKIAQRVYGAMGKYILDTSLF